jgi:hypothetical protein
MMPRLAGARPLRGCAPAVGADRGLRIDLDERDAPIGFEITALAAVTIAELNAVLAQHGTAARAFGPNARTKR